MKKIIALLLAALLLAGCQPASAGTDTPAGTTTMAHTETYAEEETTVPILPLKPIIPPTQPGDSLDFSNPGKARIAYTGKRSYVKYITSADQLPNEEALKGYDAEFFENNALLIVVETVSSGSVKLELEGIYLNGDTATVTLKRSMPGDFGTADMATWLLWAEVSREWDYTWVLETGNKQPQGEMY